MKKILTYISIISAGLFISTSSAEAKKYTPGYNTTYVSGYYACGTPIYTKKIFTHYDRLGRAVFSYLRVAPRARAQAPRRKITYTKTTNKSRTSDRYSSRRY